MSFNYNMLLENIRDVTAYISLLSPIPMSILCIIYIKKYPFYNKLNKVISYMLTIEVILFIIGLLLINSNFRLLKFGSPETISEYIVRFSFLFIVISLALIPFISGILLIHLLITRLKNNQKFFTIKNISTLTILLIVVIYIFSTLFFVIYK